MISIREADVYILRWKCVEEVVLEQMMQILLALVMHDSRVHVEVLDRDDNGRSAYRFTSSSSGLLDGCFCRGGVLLGSCICNSKDTYEYGIYAYRTEDILIMVSRTYYEIAIKSHNSLP